MRYFPINLDLAGKKALVVGGGAVAYRRVKTLVKCGADVTVVSPAFIHHFKNLKAVKRIRRRYQKSDLRSASIVLTATDSQEVNRQVVRDACRRKIPINVCDHPEHCTFTLPAIVSKGPLLVTISTQGISPSIAGRIREKIENEIDPVFIQHLALLGEIRPVVKSMVHSKKKRMELLKKMGGKKVHDFIKRNGVRPAKKMLLEMLSREAVES